MKKMIAILCAVVLVASAVIGVTSVRSGNKIKDLNNDLSVIQDALNESQKNVESLTEEVSAKQTEIETLTADVAEKAAEIEHLTADVADKDAQITSLTADVAAKAAEIESLNTAAAANEEQIRTLTEQAAAAQTAIDTLTEETAAMNAQIDSLTADLTSAQQRLQVISDAINGVMDNGDQAVFPPQVGEVVDGFEVKEIRDFPIIGAQIILFEHQQTGAQLTYVANSDTNRAFQLTFRTRPLDNTGLPHVFEHACTAGSEKYPSAALWFNLAYQTYNTYMNAYTTDAMTCYPLASLSEEQLLKYADYYTDSCLHPMILRDESIYRTEAWRYRMASEEEPLTLEGTVYSEMLGAYTLSRAALDNANRLTFPGAALSYNYGGIPDFIPDMTWDMLREYHAKYYHPSNCMVYLYGQFEDYTAFLQLLNEAFAPYEKAEFPQDESDYVPLTEALEQTVAYPTTADSDPQNQSYIYYYIPCPGMKGNVEQENAMDNLTILLSQQGSALMQALRKALPTGSFSVGREVAAPEDAILFLAGGVNPEDAPLFRETVDTVLKQIAQEGFAQDMVDSVMASAQLSNKLANESGDPVNGILQSLAYQYVTTGNPFAYLESLYAVDKLDEMNQNGTYQQVLNDWLVDKPVYSLVTTYPAPGEKEKQDAALAEKLAQIKESMTAEERQAIIDATNAEPKEDDASALVAQLQAVTVESLPEEIRLYDVNDVTGEDGIRRIDAVAGVDGVGQAMIYLDAAALPQEDIHYMRLFTRLLGSLDTDAHTKEELDVLTARYLYSQVIGVDTNGNLAGYHPYLCMEWIAMDDDLAAGYDLMDELVFHTQFTDVERLTELVAAQKTAVRATINSNGNSVALYRAAGARVPWARYYSYLNFVEYYNFLNDLEAQLAENPEAVVQRLQAVQAFFANSNGAISAYAGNPASIELNRGLADAFLAKLENTPREPVTYDLPGAADREALILDANVQHNVQYSDFKALGLEDFDASLAVISQMVSDQFLTPILRDQYGVYTPFASANQDIGVYLLAYRDPNVKETYDVYAQLPQMIENIEIGQDVLDGYILNVYSSLAKPAGELTGATAALSAAIQGVPQERTLDYMRQVKATTVDTVKASAAVFDKLNQAGIRYSAGSAAAINANAELFDVILNPFSAQDNSQVTLNDITEGDDYYEAVRFVFENALMVPAAEDSFGVQEPAQLGDWALGMFQMLGGAGTAQDAVDTLSQMGLVPAGAAEDPLTRETLVQSCTTLCTMAQVSSMDYTLPEAEGEAASRGDVALLLYRLAMAE